MGKQATKYQNIGILETAKAEGGNSMSYARESRKLISGIISLALVVTLLTTSVTAETSWTDKQTTAHEIAELARSLSLPEDSPIIVEAKRLWNEDYIENKDTYVQLYSDEDAAILAKIIYSEGGSIPSDTEKACLVWCVLNRVDAGYGDTIAAVATAPAQFGYRAQNPVRDDLLKISLDVLERWQKEKNGETDVGRVLPKDYMWYCGDGKHNNFRNSYTGGTKWDYSLVSPYSS